MKTQMTLSRITSLAAFVTLSGGTVWADFVSYSVSSPPGAGTFLAPDWTLPITVPKFNPALGTLNTIVFSMTGFVGGTAKVENTSPSSGADTKLTLASGLTLTRPGGGPALVVATPIVINTFSAAPFDGVVDFAGPSGVTILGLLGSKFNRFNYDSAADKALFTGAGTIDLPLSAVGASRATGGGSTISLFDTEARGEVTVTYRYSSAAVPEPRVYGAVGALLCAGFALLRQRRPQKS